MKGIGRRVQKHLFQAGFSVNRNLGIWSGTSEDVVFFGRRFFGEGGGEEEDGVKRQRQRGGRRMCIDHIRLQPPSRAHIDTPYAIRRGSLIERK